jgi:signal transduction histidine kinase
MAQRIQELEHDRLRFIQSAAHELRTPMTSVKGVCGLLARHLAPDTDTATLARILDSEVNHLSGLINDILNTFLLKEGRFKLDLKPVNLNEVVESSLSSFQAVAPDRFTFQAASDPVIVLADVKRLHQVFKNFLSNSVKYSDPGTPISVSVSTRESFATVSVRDAGRGVPVNQLDRVFDPFFRASNVEDTSETAGIGLGLHLCRDIIERHGGKVWVESEEGVGSTFYASLPCSC